MHAWGDDREGATGHQRVGRAGRRRARTWRRCARCRSTSRWPPRVDGADVVHSHTWYAKLAGHLAKLTLRHPARGDGALARAAAAVEGRAARRRLRALELVRAGSSLEAADARDRGLEGDRARDILACYPAIDPERVAGDLQRHRRRGVHARPGHRRARAATASTRTGRRSSSSGGSRARRASRTCSRRRCEFDPAAQLVLCAGAPDTPEIAAEVEQQRGAAAAPSAGT